MKTNKLITNNKSTLLTKSKTNITPLNNESTQQMHPDVSNNISSMLYWSVYNTGRCIGCKEEYSGCMYKINNNKYICPFCHIIKYLNLVDTSTFGLYHSKLNQMEIIKKTKEYYKINKVIPKPEELDPTIVRSSISLPEFIYMLKENKSKTKIQNSDIRIFYTNRLPTGFLDYKKSSCFDSDSDTEDFEEDNMTNDNINENNIYNNEDNEDEDNNYDSDSSDDVNNSNFIERKPLTQELNNCFKDALLS